MPHTSLQPEAARTRRFQRQLVLWYGMHSRDLPWRRTRDPYAVLVSELMLQQTQVSRALPKFTEWMQAFPDVFALAAAPTSAVLKHWQGLGYNRRALYLKRTAERVVSEYGGTFPHTREELLQLPGIGPHTVGALMSFSFGAREPIFDTNALRVVGRIVLGYTKLPNLTAANWQQLLTHTLPGPKRLYAFNQALMDLGATICLAKKPTCEQCPIRTTCLSYPAILSAQPAELKLTQTPNEKLYYGQPRRIWRGKMLRALHEASSRTGVSYAALGQKIQPDFSSARLNWLKGVVATLVKDGLAEVRGNTVRLPSQ